MSRVMKEEYVFRAIDTESLYIEEILFARKKKKNNDARCRNIR